VEVETPIQEGVRRLRVRWRRVFGAGVPALVLFLGVVRWDPGYEPPAVEVNVKAPAKGTVRIMTLNCAHGRATAFYQLLTREDHIRSNLDSIARLITAARPDVVALQELDGPSAWSGGFDHLAYLAEKTGYAYRYHGLHVDRPSFPKLAYGTGVLSRLPLQGEASLAFNMNALDTKGFVYVEVETPQGELGLVSVHLDFKRTSERKGQLEKLQAFLEQRQRKLPVVVTGDFNTSLDRDGGALHGFVDAMKLTSPGKRLLTFPSTGPRRSLDDVFLSAGLQGLHKRALDLLVSDHLPVLIDVRRVGR
jgi:endonuclease/exonuclease/phosphatase family metal-dependent hydrolase